MNEGQDMSRYPSARELREWAESRRPGVISSRGMLPRFLVIAWDRSHPGRPYRRSESHHGTHEGYCSGCRCIQCGEAEHRYYIDRRDMRDEDAADELLSDA
jgi:hypothetical protein